MGNFFREMGQNSRIMLVLYSIQNIFITNSNVFLANILIQTRVRPLKIYFNMFSANNAKTKILFDFSLQNSRKERRRELFRYSVFIRLFQLLDEW